MVIKSPILGVNFYKSKTHHGRYECVFYGRAQQQIKKWVRDQFGEDDDMVYAFKENSIDQDDGYEALLTEEQIMLMVLKWT